MGRWFGNGKIWSWFSFSAESVCSTQIWSEVYSEGIARLSQKAKYYHATPFLVGRRGFPILCQNLKSWVHFMKDPTTFFKWKAHSDWLNWKFSFLYFRAYCKKFCVSQNHFWPWSSTLHQNTNRKYWQYLRSTLCTELVQQLWAKIMSADPTPISRSTRLKLCWEGQQGVHVCNSKCK